MRKLRQLLRSTPWSDPTKLARTRGRRGSVTARLRRGARPETLEKRELLAGDIAYAHNYWRATDVDDNGKTTAADALRVINLLSRNGGPIEVTEPGQLDAYADVNADGWVTAADALAVINQLYRGEPEGDPIFEMLINASDSENQLLTGDGLGSRTATVNVGEVFFLEVSYRDFRRFGGNIGAFQILTDIGFQVEGDAAANLITPIINETQSFVLEGTIRQASSGSLTLSLEGSDESVVVDLKEIENSIPDALTNALISLGYEDDQFIVRRDSADVTQFPGQSAEDAELNLSFKIDYLDPAFTGIDLPDLQVVSSDFNNGTRALTGSEPAVNEDGSLNFAATRNNIDLRSRSWPNDGGEVTRPVYIAGQGVFDPTFGYVNVGALGPISNIAQTVGLNNLTAEPFHAFSVPLIIKQPVSDLQIFLSPSDTDERVLLYDDVATDFEVPLDQLRLGPPLLITALGPAVNNPPVALPDEATTVAGTSVDIDVLANDSDPDGDDLTVVFGQAPDKGSVSLNLDGTVRYTPSPGESGTDTFTYFANDGELDSNEATVTVTILPANDPPVLEGPVTATFSEDDEQGTVDLLTGASDPDEGDVLSAINITLVAGDGSGVTIDAANDQLFVDPSAYIRLPQGQSEVIEFHYQVSDGQGNAVAQTAIITIIGVNNPPVAVDDTAVADGTNPVLIDVLANDFDPDEGDELTILLDPENPAITARDTQFGSIRVVDDGGISKIEYTAKENVEEVDTFSYFITDGIADPVEATVTVNIFEENLPPEVEGPLVVNFTEATGVQTFDLLAGASDPNNDELSVEGLEIDPADPLGITIVGSTVSVDTAAYQFLGQDVVSEPITFTYQVSDGVLSVTQTATLTITGVNDPPVAVDDTASTIGTNPVLIDVLANDFDPDEGDTLTLALGSVEPQFGSVEIVEDGGVMKIRYTADENVERTDTFTYTISDGIADPVEATVTVNIFEQNLPPEVEGPIDVNFTEATGVQTFDLLAGASDPNNDPLSLVDLQISPADPLGVTIVGTTVSVDTAAYQFLGQDVVSDPISFSYQITDGEFFVTQTATLTITGVNDPPVAVDDTASTLKNSPAVIDVLANDFDPDIGDTLTVEDVTDGANGTVTVNADGTVTYTPDTDFTGEDSFIYTVTDGLETSQATVTVTVNDFAPSVITGSIFFDRIDNFQEFLNGAAPERNGSKDANESGLGAVPVNLVSDSDQNVTGEAIELTVYTDLHGNYRFDNVAPGTYRIVYEIPSTIVFGVNGDGSAEAGVMQVMIGAAGGETFEDMNFTLIDTIGSALGNIDILSSSYLRSNTTTSEASQGGRRGGLVSLSDSGEQLFFKAMRGFDNVRHAELALNESRDAALLTVIDEDGTLLTARLSDDHFVVNRDGTAVQFFGGFEDFNFTSPASSMTSEFEDYRNAIDKVIGSI